MVRSQCAVVADATAPSPATHFAPERNKLKVFASFSDKLAQHHGSISKSGKGALDISAFLSSHLLTSS